MRNNALIGAFDLASVNAIRRLAETFYARNIPRPREIRCDAIASGASRNPRQSAHDNRPSSKLSKAPRSPRSLLLLLMMMMMMMRPLRQRRWTAIGYGVIDNRSENLAQ
jgi:hypothetical protein